MSLDNNLIIERLQGDMAAKTPMKVLIDGTQIFQLTDQPIYISGLKDGRHTIKASLRFQSKTESFLMPSDRIIVGFGGAGIVIQGESVCNSEQNREHTNNHEAGVNISESTKNVFGQMAKGFQAFSKQIGESAQSVVKSASDSMIIPEDIASTDWNEDGETPLCSYGANTGLNPGRLDAYKNRMVFTSNKGEKRYYPYTEIDEYSLSHHSIFIHQLNGLGTNLYMAEADAQAFYPVLKNNIEDVWKKEKPEELFNKSFGLIERVLVNETMGTFRIKDHNNRLGKIYRLNDIVNFEIQEIDKGGNPLTGAMVGGYFAGRSGAVLGAMAASNPNDITAVICRIVVKTDSGNEVLSAKIASPVFAASKEGKKYSEIKAEEMKLDSYLKQFVGGSEEEHETIPNIDPADEIRKYKKLLDDGIITEEEFNGKKAQLLGL